MNFRQLAYGLLSYLPLPRDWLTPRTGGTESAEYCYSVWLRHLVLANVGGMNSLPTRVAELGPGDSLGVGMAAIISGVDQYLAFDAVHHAGRHNDLAIFDRLVEMFLARQPIPGLDVFPEMVLDLPSYAFPSDLLNNSHMAKALDHDRIAMLRKQISGEVKQQEVIVYRAPWDRPRPSELDSVDFVMSNAVLEHVEDIDAAYRAMHDWLKPLGWSSHQIDFRSHSLFRGWDGHWACPKWLWTLMQGRRAYLLNRLPLSAHLRALHRAGFKVAHLEALKREPECSQLASGFRHLDAEDRCTSGAYLLLRKSEAG